MKKPRYLTDEERSAVRRMNRHGMRDIEIAQILGREKECISATRRKMGLPLNKAEPNTIPGNPEMVAAVGELYAQNLSQKEVARRLGIARRYVYQIAKDNGFERPKHSGPRKDSAALSPPPSSFAAHNSPIILVGFSHIPAWAQKYGDRVSLRP